MKMSRVLGRLQKSINEFFHRNDARLDLKNPIITFTFDDVPTSAVLNGHKILSKYDYKATYYVASGIGLPFDKEFFFLNENDLTFLKDNNHEIACHTHHHKSLRFKSKATINDDIKLNIDLINEVVKVDLTNFSYPYGQVGLNAKSTMGRKFDTSRSTEFGLNTGLVDLNNLKAVNLYSNDFDKDKLIGLLNDAVSNNSWLIFYTHDVCDEYTQWGTSIKDFEWLVDLCHTRGLDVLTIKNVVKENFK